LLYSLVKVSTLWIPRLRVAISYGVSAAINQKMRLDFIHRIHSYLIVRITEQISALIKAEVDELAQAWMTTAFKVPRITVNAGIKVSVAKFL
jgi:hypothetical protein